MRLESEGGLINFRNLRIKELPSTNPKPSEIARSGEGFVPLYANTDLDSWIEEPGHKGHWQGADWVLKYDGKSEAKEKDLWTKKEYGDFTLLADWRLPGKPKKMKRPVILPSGDYATDGGGADIRLPRQAACDE